MIYFYFNCINPLAEILLTLVIVGIVASLTIPAMIQNTMNAEFKTAWKSSFADVDLATRRMTLDNGGSLVGVFSNLQDMKRNVRVFTDPADYETNFNGVWVSGIVVVFDILRATSSMVTALANGVEKIYPCKTVEEAFALKKKMPKHNQQLGRLGESIAADYLRKKGYTILQKNFQKRYSEIDLIARDREMFVFVEVKTRFNTDFGSPEESVSFFKERSIRRAAEYYLTVNEIEIPARIDLVAVTVDQNQNVINITHLENISDGF